MESNPLAGGAPPPLPRRSARPTDAPSGAERRTATRVELEAEIGVYSDTNFYTGYSLDLSEGGIFVATYNLEPIGTEIELDFTLPGGFEVMATGGVRWLRDPIEAEDDVTPGMGIQFQALTSEQKAHLVAFIEERAPLFYDGDDI